MLYKTHKLFICTILFGLSESYKITLFKYLVGKIIEAKVAENERGEIINMDFIDSGIYYRF